MRVKISDLTADDLPGVLSEMAHATSVASALKVAQAVGGTRVYIPARVQEDHWLCHIVGHADAKAICAAIAPAQSGLDILVPMGPTSHIMRWRKTQALIDKGLPKREIARAVGIHERGVQRLRNGHLKSVAKALRQGDFF
jgi:hypothetical protein